MPSSEQGVTLDRYMLIPRTLIFIVSETKVLLLKGAPHKRLWANHYNGIGGHIERGEDVHTAAHRELQEEAGLTSPDLRLCGTILIDSGQNPGILLFVMKGTSLSADPHPPAENQTFSEGNPEWIAVDELSTLPLVGDLPTLLPRVLSHQPGEPPFSGRYWYDEEGKLRIEMTM